MRGSKAKPISAESASIVNVSLDTGDWVDVMDGEGTWNVAQILSFPTPKTVEVSYDGWGEEYNEVVELNGGRVAPYHTYTWSVKVWAKYKNWPWWPAIVTIRPPGTEGGRTHLMNESKLFVDFLDQKLVPKRCRTWIERAFVRPFQEKFDERRKRTTGSDFESSLARCLQSIAVEKFPVFGKTGTLPAQYSTKIAESVKQMKKEMSLRLWVTNFNTNRRRHRSVYVYNAPGDEDSSDDDDGRVVEFDSPSDEETKSKKSRAKTKTTRTLSHSKNPKSPRTKRTIKKEEPFVNDLTDDARGGPGVVEEQPIYLDPIDDGVPETTIKLEPTSDESKTPSRKRKAGLSVGQDTDALSPTSRKKQWLEELRESTLQDRQALDEDHESPAESDPQNFGGPHDTGSEPAAEGVDDLHADADEDEDDADMAPLDSDEELMSVDDIVSGSEDEEAAEVAAPIDPLDDWETARSTGPNATAATTSTTTAGVVGDGPAAASSAEPDVSSMGASGTILEIADAGVEAIVLLGDNEISATTRSEVEIPESASSQVVSIQLDQGPDEALSQGEVEAAPVSSVPSQACTTAMVEATSEAEHQPIDPISSEMPAVQDENSAESIVEAARAPKPFAPAPESNRRSSMQVTGASKEKNRRSRGRTPVWVIPPPKFQTDLGPDASPPPRRPVARVIPAPAAAFSSLSMFDGTDNPFSLDKWIRHDLYDKFTNK